MKPNVSVIICTRNRAEDLRQTLEAMASVEVPVDLPTELIVVDNGSTDGTRAVVESARLEGMSVRYAVETTTGQCHARNRGLAEAVGEVILFTDDDVRPPANWIEGMARPILSGEADAVAGGVRLAGHLEGAWMEPMHRSWLASTEEIDPARPHRMVGANMAFGRHVLREVPAFDTELGPGALGFGDDSQFSRQLLHSGFRLKAAFDVVVEHHCDASRVVRGSFLRSAVRLGRSTAYADYHWRHVAWEQTLAQRARAQIGLWGRRLAYGWRDMLKGEAGVWELRRVLAIAYSRQMRIESRRPRRYGRRAARAHGFRADAVSVNGLVNGEGAGERSADQPSGAGGRI